MKTININEITYQCPFEDLLPPLSEEELNALREDIRANGVTVPVIVTDQHEILDGHNRLRIAVELGLPNVPTSIVRGLDDDQKRRRAEELNLHRRHMTREQRQELIARRLKANPERSNNAIAGELQVDDKTVATVRQKLESTSEIPKLTRTKGRDGESRTATRSKRPPKKRPEAPVEEAFQPLDANHESCEGAAVTSTSRPMSTQPLGTHHESCDPASLPKSQPEVPTPTVEEVQQPPVPEPELPATAVVPESPDTPPATATVVEPEAQQAAESSLDPITPAHVIEPATWWPQLEKRRVNLDRLAKHLKQLTRKKPSGQASRQVLKLAEELGQEADDLKKLATEGATGTSESKTRMSC